MEREKMIEEIARLICENEKPCYACLKCTIYDGKICCKYLRIAEKIVNLIIHEGTVVLTKDELADTQARMAYLQEELGKLLRGDNISVSAREYGQLLYANENASKETAKDIWGDISKAIKVKEDIYGREYQIIYEEEIFKLKKKLKEKYGVEA